MVLPQIVSIPLLFDLLVVHGSEGVITLTAYSANLVQTFLDEVHLFGAFHAGNDEGFSQDQIFGLELPDLGLFVVAGEKLLLVGYDASDGLLALLLCYI